MHIFRGLRCWSFSPITQPLHSLRALPFIHAFKGQPEWHRKAAGCKIGTMIKMIDHNEEVIDIPFSDVAYLAKRSTPRHITLCKTRKCLQTFLWAQFWWLLHRSQIAVIQPSKGCVLKAFQPSTLMTEWALRHNHRLMKYTDSVLPLTLLPEPLRCRKYLLPRTASLNRSYCASVFATPSGRQIDIEPPSRLGPSSY